MGPALGRPLLLLLLVAALFLAARPFSRRGRRARFAACMLRRGAWMLVTLTIVFTASFFLMRAVPGGPFESERAQDPVVRRNLEARYRLDLPLQDQYLMSLSSVLAGDLGPSMQIRDYTVNEVVAEGLPLSASLGLAALAWTLVLGIPFGALAAMRRGRWTDRILMGFAALGMSIPNFVLAGLLMIPLVFETHLFPPAGYGTLRALVLPSFCLGLPFAAQVARLTRTGLLDVLGSDWIRTARAKGLSPRAVVLRHGFRGALTPVITFLGPALAGILTGSLVIERIFAIPGIGTHFVQSALERDYTLAMGMVLVYSLILYVLNWLVDLAHAALDPRVRLA